MYENEKKCMCDQSAIGDIQQKFTPSKYPKTMAWIMDKCNDIVFIRKIYFPFPSRSEKINKETICCERNRQVNLFDRQGNCKNKYVQWLLFSFLSKGMFDFTIFNQMTILNTII